MAATLIWVENICTQFINMSVRVSQVSREIPLESPSFNFGRALRVDIEISTVYIHLSGNWLTEWPIIRIGLALPVNIFYSNCNLVGTTGGYRGKYSIHPFIRKLVNRIANNPDRLGPSRKYFLTLTVLHLFMA